MIDIKRIITRSWHILWNYRILWIFGFLLAITGGGGGGNSGSGYQFGGNSGNNNGNNGTTGTNPNFQPGPYLTELTNWFNQNLKPLFEHPEQYVATIVWIGVAFLLFILLISLVTALIHYPSETAVIRMVDEYEQTGSKTGFKHGWKLGWNRRAFRIWVIDLIIGLPILIFISLLIILGVLVFLSIRNGASALAISGTVASIGCAFLFIFIFVILMVFISLLRQFFVRSAALDETGIGDSFRQGWSMFKSNWKSAGLMWLVMLGIGIGYGIVGLILFFLLIPAYLILLLPAALVAAIPGGIAFAITSLLGGGPVTWIVAAVVAIPVFFMITLAPLAFTSGWYITFTSSVWTLTYREIKSLNKVKLVEIPPEHS
jgi:hypothetical protein